MPTLARQPKADTGEACRVSGFASHGKTEPGEDFFGSENGGSKAPRRRKLLNEKAHLHLQNIGSSVSKNGSIRLR
jgi:hypothetical protein